MATPTSARTAQATTMLEERVEEDVFQDISNSSSECGDDRDDDDTTNFSLADTTTTTTAPVFRTQRTFELMGREESVQEKVRTLRHSMDDRTMRNMSQMVNVWNKSLDTTGEYIADLQYNFENKHGKIIKTVETILDTTGAVVINLISKDEAEEAPAPHAVSIDWKTSNTDSIGKSRSHRNHASNSTTSSAKNDCRRGDPSGQKKQQQLPKKPPRKFIPGRETPDLVVLTTSAMGGSNVTSEGQAPTPTHLATPKIENVSQEKLMERKMDFNDKTEKSLRKPWKMPKSRKRSDKNERKRSGKNLNAFCVDSDFLRRIASAASSCSSGGESTENEEQEDGSPGATKRRQALLNLVQTPACIQTFHVRENGMEFVKAAASWNSNNTPQSSMAGQGSTEANDRDAAAIDEDDSSVKLVTEIVLEEIPMPVYREEEHRALPIPSLLTSPPSSSSLEATSNYLVELAHNDDDEDTLDDLASQIGFELTLESFDRVCDILCETIKEEDPQSDEYSEEELVEAMEDYEETPLEHNELELVYHQYHGGEEEDKYEPNEDIVDDDNEENSSDDSDNLDDYDHDKVYENEKHEIFEDQWEEIRVSTSYRLPDDSYASTDDGRKSPVSPVAGYVSAITAYVTAKQQRFDRQKEVLSQNLDRITAGEDSSYSSRGSALSSTLSPNAASLTLSPFVEDESPVSPASSVRITIESTTEPAKEVAATPKTTSAPPLRKEGLTTYFTAIPALNLPNLNANIDNATLNMSLSEDTNSKLTSGDHRDAMSSFSIPILSPFGGSDFSQRFFTFQQQQAGDENQFRQPEAEARDPSPVRSNGWRMRHNESGREDDSCRREDDDSCRRDPPCDDDIWTVCRRTDPAGVSPLRTRQPSKM